MDGDAWGVVTINVFVPCRLLYLLERRTQSGAIGAVIGLYCEVISNIIMVVDWGVNLQNSKRVVASCMSLVDRLQEMAV
jgi:hypothetical protein